MKRRVVKLAEISYITVGERLVFVYIHDVIVVETLKSRAESRHIVLMEIQRRKKHHDGTQYESRGKHRKHRILGLKPLCRDKCYTA